MTNRTIGPIGNGYSSYYYYKQQTGGNGRTEVAFGKKRSKWNDYAMEKSEMHGEPSDTPSSFYINVMGLPPFATLFDNNLQNAALSKLASKVKGHDFNLAVAVGEGKQTMSMVYNALTSIGGAVVAARRGDFRLAASHFATTTNARKFKSKELAGRWLELQYGWLPLLSDVHESVNAYHALTKHARTNTVSAQVTERGTFDGSQSQINWSGIGPYKASRRIIYEMTENISAPRSLGLTDPLTLMWELLPYSFVVDWFIPIGSYLENLNVIPSLRGRFMTCDLWKYENKSVVLKPLPYYRNASSTFEYVKFTRTVSTGLQVQAPNFVSLPDVLSPKRFANALALLRQKF